MKLTRMALVLTLAASSLFLVQIPTVTVQVLTCVS
jgi:hypothetical protein